MGDRKENKKGVLVLLLPRRKGKKTSCERTLLIRVEHRSIEGIDEEFVGEE